MACSTLNSGVGSPNWSIAPFCTKGGSPSGSPPVHPGWAAKVCIANHIAADR